MCLRPSLGLGPSLRVHPSAEKSSFVTVWTSFIQQCKEQSAIGTPELCTAENAAKKVCKPETGFAAGAVPITFQRPTCPADFYVLGHIGMLGSNGMTAAEEPPVAYKCLHETILRRALFKTQPILTGAQRKTSVWNAGLVAKTYLQKMSLWQPDCQAENCGGWPRCADSVTQGLFYASGSETLPDLVVTGDASTTKPTGPRCLVHFRDCTPKNADGKFASNPGGALNQTFISACDSELGLRSINPRITVQGVTTVTPSGLPHLSTLPVVINIRAANDVCTYIASRDPDGVSEGLVFVNRVLTLWVPGSMTLSSCSFSVRVPLTGAIKPGPATIEITTKEIGTVTSRTRDATGRYTGVYIGRLYIYVDPSHNATLIEKTNFNGATCSGITVVKLPYFTQVCA